jgi:hypothetical protein
VDYDAAWHLQNGIAANQSGDFAVAIYESAYASTVQGIIGNGTPANLSSAVLSGLEGSRSSLWGRLYFDHGKYLYYNAMNSKAIPTDAYSMLVYSQALDSNQYEIDNALKQNDGKSTLPMPDSGQEGNFGGKNGDYAVAFSLAFFAFVLGAEIFRRLYFQMR